MKKFVVLFLLLVFGTAGTYGQAVSVEIVKIEVLHNQIWTDFDADKVAANAARGIYTQCRTEPAMKFTFTYIVRNMRGKSVTSGIAIAKETNNGLIPITGSNGSPKFWFPKNNQRVALSYDNARVSDIEVFVPYSDLGLPSANHKLVAVVLVADANTNRFLIDERDPSNQYRFNLELTPLNQPSTSTPSYQNNPGTTTRQSCTYCDGSGKIHTNNVTCYGYNNDKWCEGCKRMMPCSHCHHCAVCPVCGRR